MNQKTSSTRTRIQHNTKGFTLIELAIVVVIIGGLMALIAPKIMAKGKETSTRSAAITIIKDGDAVKAANGLYASKNNKDIPVATGLSDLVTANMLATMTPSTSWEDSAFTGTYAYTLNNTTYTTQFGSASADLVLILDGVTEDICQEIDIQKNIIAVGGAIPAAVTSNQLDQCFGNGGATGYRYLKVVSQY